MKYPKGKSKTRIKVLCEQTREESKRIKVYFFGLSLILFGFGNIVADFHVLFKHEEIIINQKKIVV